MLHLKVLLPALGLTQSGLTKHLRKYVVGISTATVSLLCNYGHWPRSRSHTKEYLISKITEFLQQNDATPEQIACAFEPVPGDTNGGEPQQRCNAAVAPLSPGRQGQSENQEEQEMLLRAQRLTPEARQQFGILRDPFVNEIRDVADVFETSDIRYVRASVRQTALHGGMLAVISESGGGKSVIRKDTQAWVNNGHDEIIVIEPYVVGTSNHTRVGKPLLASDITARVIKTLDPHAKLRSTLEARTDQMHAMLRESSKLGHKHVLIIEEAHDLAVPTLKSLKRFYEIEDGFAKLLSIVLIGQTELRRKLSEKNPEVREVVQRCELITLPPLDNHVGEYLAHKFKRVDVDVAKVLDAGAVAMIRTVLRRTVTETFGGKKQSMEQSLCYPLAINNLVTRAMNLAAEIGAPKVTAELVEAAIKGD